MNLLGKVSPAGDKKLGAAKATLNPNAAEFLPSSLKSPVATVTSPDASSKFPNATLFTPGKAILDRSASSISTKSDDEAQQYWSLQLPDDITPDFKGMGIEDNHGINNLPVSALSIADINEGSRYSVSTGSGYMLKEHQGLSIDSYAEKTKFNVSSYEEFHPSLSKPWDKQILRNDLLLASETPYNGNSGHGFLSDMSNEQLMENADMNPLEFLASQFPGFAADSLADVYFANGGDMNLTIEMLTQLELQVDGGLRQAMNSKALSTPNLGAMDFPSLSPTNGQNGLGKFTGGATDFASAVRKMATQESSIWKYDRNGSPKASVGSSRSSQVLASSYNNGRGKGVYGNRLQNQGSARASPVWLETGEAVANMYSGMREEARDHARVRNVYFEQARHSYLIGNKALAKELSIKGQLHNMQMKAAHDKAQESIYRQRNSDMQVNGRERMIDLHGLHVNEAIHVLKGELAVMKNAARSADQRLLVYICVGTGHQTRGSCTPARLPTSVQRYLLEEEGLDYSEPQAGLLRVVVY